MAETLPGIYKALGSSPIQQIKTKTQLLCMSVSQLPLTLGTPSCLYSLSRMEQTIFTQLVKTEEKGVARRVGRLSPHSISFRTPRSQAHIFASDKVATTMQSCQTQPLQLHVSTQSSAFICTAWEAGVLSDVGYFKMTCVPWGVSLEGSATFPECDSQH